VYTLTQVSISDMEASVKLKCLCHSQGIGVFRLSRLF
jgi:hypothetical protein